MNNAILPCVIGLIVLLITLPAAADEINESDTALRQSQSKDSDEKLANLWDLSIDEYREYQLIMEGPRGNWTPNLDPITVLGINAKSLAERNEYAEKLAKLERARVTRELAFEMAYQQAQQKLFGHIPLYETAEAKVAQWSGLGEASKAKTVNVFINSLCETCKAVSTRILKSGVSVNFYFVGFTAEAIKQWAVDLGITGQMINSKKVTLNFDGGRSNTLAIKRFPFIQESL